MLHSIVVASISLAYKPCCLWICIRALCQMPWASLKQKRRYIISEQMHPFITSSVISICPRTVRKNRATGQERPFDWLKFIVSSCFNGLSWFQFSLTLSKELTSTNTGLNIPIHNVQVYNKPCGWNWTEVWSHYFLNLLISDV